MSWSWIVFSVSFVICAFVVTVARGAMNDTNIRTNPGQEISGWILAATFAAIITAATGLL
jgi:hypothetical protein